MYAISFVFVNNIDTLTILGVLHILIIYLLTKVEYRDSKIVM